MNGLRAAVVAWKLREIRSDSEYFAHFYDLVNEAHELGAQLVVFPELQVLELLHLAPEVREQDGPLYLSQFAQETEDWIRRISESSGLIIVGGSYFKETPEGVMNCTAIGHPEFGLALGYKNNLTTYERAIWNLRPGTGLAKPHDARLGVTLCYDAEFPESGRALAEEGVLVQCIPAFTETQHGFNRVRWCAQARATENQNYVIHASLVGDIGREPVPSTYGNSAILCPSVEQYPLSGVLDETPLNEEGIAIADLSFDLLDLARETGDVRNWNDRHRGDWLLRREP